VLDIERGQENAIKPYVWQTDTCVGGWFYDVRQVYKTPAHVIEMLVDIVSKNGNLLLNLPQRPDGTLDDECLNILRELAAWFKVNADGIHGTRPWRVAGEGPTVHESKAWSFKEDAANWTTADFRFTAKGASVFAFQMKAPAQQGGEAFVRSLGKHAGVAVKTVRLPGGRQDLWHRQCEDGLLVRYPSTLPCATVPCIEVVLDQ